MLGLWRKRGTIPEMPVRHHSIVTWEKGHVRASVIELGEGTAELIGVGAAPVHGIGRASHPDLDRWSLGCEKALSQAEDMTLVSSGRKVVPNYVTMSVPAEINHNLPVAVTHPRRRADRGVTFEELAALLRRGYRQAQDILGTRSKSAAEDIICGSVAQVSLDGQAIADPVGLRGEQLELHMNFCLAPLEWIRALEIISERLEMELTSIVPHHMAYASPLPDAAALLVLLDDHCSMINMVRRGRLAWGALVEVGERDMIGATAGVLNLQGQQADALMRAYRARELREDVEMEVARAFWRQLRGWMTALAEGVKAHVPGVRVPHLIYFLDITRRIPEACNCLVTPFWEHCLPFGRCPVVIKLGVNMVRNVLDCTAQASGPRYLLLRGLGHYVARLYAPGDNLDRVLARTIRWRRVS